MLYHTQEQGEYWYNDNHIEGCCNLNFSVPGYNPVVQASFKDTLTRENASAPFLLTPNKKKCFAMSYENITN
jgi:hypothetical protein